MTGSVPTPLTLDREIRQLPAGHTLEWDGTQARAGSYWVPNFCLEVVNEECDVNDVREALLDSVEHHFVSDVPVAIFLSGGLDSTALLALAHATGRRNLHTFSIGLNDKKLDESGLAAKTSMHFGCQHVEWRIQASEAITLAVAFLDSMDMPSIDGFNSFLVSQLTSKHGVKVALSGLGGDELFGSYGSFQLIPKLLRLHRMLDSLPSAGLVIGEILQRFAWQPSHRRLGYFLSHPATSHSAYTAVRGIFTFAEASHIAKHFGIEKATESLQKSTSSSASALNIGDEVSRLELTNYMQNQLLRDSDIMSMTHGLELRVPFLDRRLFDVLAKIPANNRLSPNKDLLGEAVPEIPHWIKDQPKRGFVLPYKEWLTQGLGSNIRQALAGVRFTTWYQAWSIYVLETFLTKHGFEYSPAH
ncbi:MAG: asparagine synthetase B family protein [Nitrospira sp.]